MATHVDTDGTLTIRMTIRGTRYRFQYDATLHRVTCSGGHASVMLPAGVTLDAPARALRSMAIAAMQAEKIARRRERFEHFPEAFNKGV